MAEAASWTPLVGRESEVALLLERWQQSQAGLGQVVLLSGEAGIGKSRLVEVLRQHVVSAGSPRIVLRCSPYHTHSALYPVIQHLQRVLEWRRDETPTVTLDTLERTLQVYDLAADEAVPLVAALLSVPIPEGRYPRLGADAPAAAATDPGRLNHLAAGRSRAAAGPGCSSEDLALGRSLDAGIARPRHRAGAHGADADTGDRAPGVRPPWAPRFHLTKGLELLATLPETPARAQPELDLQIALGPALMAMKGYAAPEVEQTYARARALCAQVVETPQLFPTLRGLCRFYHTRGALLTASRVGRTARPAGAARGCTDAPPGGPRNALGGTLFYLGEYAAALTHLEQEIALTDPATQRGLMLSHEVAPGVRCLALAAWTLWCLGTPAQALQRSHEALALAQSLAIPRV